MGLCQCNCFKQAPVVSSEKRADGRKNRKTGQRRKDNSESDSPSSESLPTTVSKPRKHRMSQYRKFFQGQRAKDLAFTQRLSTINNDRLINFIELPLSVNLNEGTDKPCWITFRTPSEFFGSLGYQKKKVLGRGAYGTVLLIEKCVPLVTGGEVPKDAKAVDQHFAYYQMACKVIVLPDNEDRYSRRLFESLRAELYVLQGLRGKYIISYLEHFVLRYLKPGRSNTPMLMAHIFMEVADAGSMVKEVEKKGPLPLNLARHYFAEMAQGLEFLHRNQIAHNDFKLDNVLLVTDPERPKVKHIKISDFGMSGFAFKEDVGLIYANKFLGTRHYCAPELHLLKLLPQEQNQASNNQAYLPFAADIWALAVCLYVMLTRQFPYDPPKTDDKKQAAKFFAQMSRGILKVKDAKQKFGSSKLANLLCGMFEFNPEKRLTIAAVTKHSWLRLKSKPID